MHRSMHRSIQSGGSQLHKVAEQNKKAAFFIFIGNVDTEGRRQPIFFVKAGSPGGGMLGQDRLHSET